MQTKIRFAPGAALLMILGSLAAASAMADANYPAANFSPSVVYSNPELVGKATAWTSATASPVAEVHAADPKYPAAYFQPSVIQKAENHAAASATAASAPAPQHDPKYPAAYFAPEVIHSAK